MAHPSPDGMKPEYTSHYTYNWLGRQEHSPAPPASRSRGVTNEAFTSEMLQRIPADKQMGARRDPLIRASVAAWRMLSQMRRDVS
jgi:hypothetical protein